MANHFEPSLSTEIVLTLNTTLWKNCIANMPMATYIDNAEQCAKQGLLDLPGAELKPKSVQMIPIHLHTESQ